MTIDEAINQAREVASRKFDDKVHCIRCAEEHEQLAEWLEELKAYREIGTVEGYKNAIECYTREYTIRKSNIQYDKYVIKQYIDKIVEELELHSFELGTDTIPVRYVRLNDAIEIVKKNIPLIH